MAASAEGGRGGKPADASAGHDVGLTEAADEDRAVAHALAGGEAGVKFPLPYATAFGYLP